LVLEKIKFFLYRVKKYQRPIVSRRKQSVLTDGKHGLALFSALQHFVLSVDLLFFIHFFRRNDCSHQGMPFTGTNGTIDISAGSMMAETISLAKIRQRKSNARSKRLPSERCYGHSSPDSYVILLDEPDQATSIQPDETKCRPIWRRTNH